jgi:hypothetical protein
MAAFYFAYHWNPGDEAVTAIVVAVLSIYSVAGFWFGRRLFLRAEDVPWAAGSKALPASWSLPGRLISTRFARKCSPWRAFARKEWQHQESTLVLFVIWALGHLAAIGLRNFYPRHTDAREILDMAWLLWVIVPLVAGSVAVAEERRLNTHEGELCAPFSTRKQFVIKLAMVIAVGVGLGGVVPYLLEIGAKAIGLGSEMEPSNLRLFFLEGGAAVVLVAFYASTLTNRVVPALATAMCLPIGLGGAYDILANGDRFFSFFHRTIFICMAWPLMAVTMLWLAYQNYTTLRTGWRIWLRNFGCAVAAFAAVALLSVGIYNRLWELVMNLEPPHGAARIAGPGHATIVESRVVHWLSVLLPDGRLWIGQRARNLSMTISGAFVPGTNWVALAGCDDGAAALKADGTLWNVTDAAHLQQIGSDSDWQKVAGVSRVFLALKRDGTAWEWGRVVDYARIRSYVVPLVAEPARLGEDSDWADIIAPTGGGPIELIKKDGTICELPSLHLDGGNGPRPLRRGRITAGKLGPTGTNWISFANCARFGEGDLAIRADGTLWACGDVPDEIFGIAAPSGPHLDAVRVGDKSDWAQLAKSSLHTVALKSNGAFSVMAMNSQTRRPSKYDDWIGVGAQFQYTWALAKDGTLCCWEDNRDDWDLSTPILERRPFLRLSRRPVIDYNILDSKDLKQD